MPYVQQSPVTPFRWDTQEGYAVDDRECGSCDCSLRTLAFSPGHPPPVGGWITTTRSGHQGSI